MKPVSMKVKTIKQVDVEVDLARDRFDVAVD